MYRTYLTASQGLITRTFSRTFSARGAAAAPDPAVVGSAMVYDFSEDSEDAAETLLQLEADTVQERLSRAWQRVHTVATRLVEPLAQSTGRLRFALR